LALHVVLCAKKEMRPDLEIKLRNTVCKLLC